ncbi:MAG TPA: TIR domain-containing protein, partial [Chthoniobacterales bacterium]
MAHDVFVSHSAKDKTVSDALVAKLEEQGIRCWVAPRDVVPGADWGESIIDAIESSRIMVLIFSANANVSPQIKREIERAVDKGVYTIPFRIEDVQPTKALEYFISSAHWLDAFSQPLGQHLDSLAKTIKAILSTPRPGSAAETAPPVTPLEKTPSSVPEPTPVYPPPPAEQAAPPPPALPRIEGPGSAPSQANTPKPPASKMWAPVIIGIAAVLLVGGIVARILMSRARVPSTVSQVSSSPAPEAVSPSPKSAASPRPTTEPQLKSAPEESSDDIPSEREIKQLVLDTLLLFNEAVKTKNFDAFHAELGSSWKNQTAPRKLMTSFRQFVDKGIDIAEIADVDPTFDEAPAKNEEGDLVVKGRYALEDRDVLFECTYEKEQSS